jgi:dihydrofolate reductase
VTRNAEWAAAGAERASSIEDALRLLEGAERVFVIGGGEIYAAALTCADELLLTEIDVDVEGETRFPAWGPSDFVEVSRDERRSEDGTRFAFVTYRRPTG